MSTDQTKPDVVAAYTRVGEFNEEVAAAAELMGLRLCSIELDASKAAIAVSVMAADEHHTVYIPAHDRLPVGLQLFKVLAYTDNVCFKPVKRCTQAQACIADIEELVALNARLTEITVVAHKNKNMSDNALCV